MGVRGKSEKTLYSGLHAETVKSTLGGFATGRKVEEIGGDYQLRDPSGPYDDHLGVEKDDMGPKNTYFWDEDIA